MLVAKGSQIVLTLADDRTIYCAPGAEALHDATGGDWPDSSVLIVGYHRTGDRLTCVPQDARAYFGDHAEVRRGRVELPPKRVSSWTRVGDVRCATYVRRGEHAGDWEHEFGRRRMFGLMPGNPLPVCCRRGETLRIDGVVAWDWRGISG